MHPLLSLEEHFFSTSSPPALQALYSEQLRHIPTLLPKLTSLSTLRLADMDAGGIQLQVISHAPGLSAYPDACIAANNQLASAITDHPTRFAGLAVLPMSDPILAASEFRRAVTELKFVGALVDNHASGHFYDGNEYDIFWQAAEELRVPVYLHPTWTEEMGRYEGNYGTGAARSLASSGMGWHTETGMHFLRLFASGLFDRRPGLKVVLGHFGEGVSFWLERVGELSKRWGEFGRGFTTVWDENVWVTTSGVWGMAAMRCVLGNTRVERVLYSVDYPFQKNEVGLKWMEELEASGLVSEEGLKGIAYENAESLLGIKMVT
ncbi:hypothetical protein OQA88_1307 [Cercophora sp. LCS_1]